MKKVILLLLLGFAVSANSQNVKITGRVNFDDNNTDYMYNLLVYAILPDTVLISGQSFQTKTFEIVVPQNNHFLIRLSSMGYRIKERSIDRDNFTTINLGDIRLETNSISLDEVTVVAKQPLVKMKANKITVNVKNSTLSDAGSVMDMLKRTPGLARKGENGIIVPGRGKPKIIVDGKEIKDRDILDVMSSNDIESIEIDRFSSSAYSASVKAVVHIKTIKRMKDNMYMQISNRLSANHKLSTEPALQFKIKQGIISSKMNYNYSDMNSVVKEKYYKYIYHPAYTSSNTSNVKLNSNSQRHSGLWATDIDINSKNRIGLEYFFSSSKRDEHTYNENEFKDQKGVINKIINQKNESKNTKHSISLSYNYDISKMSSLAFVADYASVNNGVNNVIDEVNETTANASKMNILSDSKYKVFTASLKYKFELPYKIRTDIGAQYSNVNNPSEVKTNNVLNRVEVNMSYTSLKDQVAATYFSLNKEWGNFNLQFGLRYEYARTKGSTVSDTTSTVDRSFSDLFPKLEMNYTINKNLSLSLNLSRYIRRPSFRALNPSVFYEDSLSYVSGNPFVKPSYFNEVALSSQWKNISLSVTYTNIKDVRIQTAISDNKNNINITKMIPINLDRSEMYGVDLGYSFHNKRLSVYSSVGMEIPNQKVPYLDEIREIKKPFWNCSLNCEYNLSEMFTLHGDFFYDSANESMITYQEATNGLNIGIRGSFLKKKLIVDLYGTDLLGGSNFNNLQDKYLNIVSGTTGKSDIRGVQLRVSFVIFDKNKISVKAQRGNGNILERTD